MFRRFFTRVAFDAGNGATFGRASAVFSHFAGLGFLGSGSGGSYFTARFLFAVMMCQRALGFSLGFMFAMCGGGKGHTGGN